VCADLENTFCDNILWLDKAAASRQKKTLRVLQFSFNERIIKEMAARQWEKGVGQRQG